MLCIKELYAPWASRANMDYNVDELDKTLSSGAQFLVKFVGLAVR